MIIKYSEFCEESCYVIKVYNNSGSYLGSFFFFNSSSFPLFLQVFIKTQRSKNIYIIIKSFNMELEVTF